jgi:nucleoside-diphosphate-sugar epimerase
VSALVVTGGSGLVGRHLLRLCPEAIAIGRPAVDLSAELEPGRLPARAEAIVHLAQSARHRDFPDGAADMFQVNVAAVARLLEYACRAGASTFVLASSGGVYAPLARPLLESDPTPPRPDLGYYLGTKLAAELLAAPYAAQLRVVILRLFFVYGPGQRAEMLVPRLVRSVLEGTPIALAGPSGLALNPTHAADAADAVRAAVSLGVSGPGLEVINVAGPEVLSLRAIGEALGRVLGRAPVFSVSPGPAPSLIADTTKMARLLIAPSRRFEASLPEIVGAP